MGVDKGRASIAVIVAATAAVAAVIGGRTLLLTSSSVTGVWSTAFSAVRFTMANSVGINSKLLGIASSSPLTAPSFSQRVQVASCEHSTNNNTIVLEMIVVINSNNIYHYGNNSSNLEKSKDNTSNDIAVMRSCHSFVALLGHPVAHSFACYWTSWRKLHDAITSILAIFIVITLMTIITIIPVIL